MIFFDLVMIGLAIITVFLAVYRNKINKRYTTIFISVLYISILIYHVIEGVKWQLVPLCFFWLLYGIYVLLKPFKKLFKMFFFVISTLNILLSAGLVYAFPTYDIPDPTGPYQIGQYLFTIEDESRLELYTEDPLDTRRFNFTMWYPADNITTEKQVKWIDNKDLSKRLATNMGLPSFVLSQINDIKSNSYLIPPISDQEETYPVVVISHGWGGFMHLHTDLAEELASQGYVVISIDHTYGSVATKFGDETVFQNLDALPDRSEDGFLDKANQLVYTYAGDITKTLDYLEEENKETSSAFFKGRLDLDHIGLIGHSTGGGAAVAVALNDDRITAVLGLDAWVEPILNEDIINGLNIPSIFLRSETWEEGPNNVNLYDLILASNQASLYQIKGTTHSDFSMAYMFSPLTQMIGYTGSLNKNYLLNMQKDIMTSWFDEHLQSMIREDIDLTIYKELIVIDVS